MKVYNYGKLILTRIIPYDNITTLYNVVIFMKEGDFIRDISKATEKILSSASIEFMEKGFEKANVRVIAKNAGVTTGSLYARYPNKDALFGALVVPVINEFMQINDKGNEEGLDKINQEKESEMWDSSQDSSKKIIELIYKNKMAFSLLINASHGSSYEGFIEKIVENEEKQFWQAVECFRKKGYSDITVSKEVVHMLMSAHIHALFEIVRHDFTKEEAQTQANQINEFFTCGWNKIFGF